MTINVLWMILALAIGLGTGQSIESTATPAPPEDGHCYINGKWYNPCPADYVPPDIPDPNYQ